jgi:hypothetical protein
VTSVITNRAASVALQTLRARVEATTAPVLRSARSVVAIDQ